MFAADDFNRRHFQMHFFLGALRVKNEIYNNIKYDGIRELNYFYIVRNVYVPTYLIVWESDATSKIVSEYDQQIPQSQTADKHIAPRGRATQQSLDTMKTNKAKQPALSSYRDQNQRF